MKAKEDETTYKAAASCSGKEQDKTPVLYLVDNMTTHLDTSLILDGQDGPEDLSFEGIRRAVELCPQERRYDMQVQVMEHLMKLRDENTEAVSLWYS